MPSKTIRMEELKNTFDILTEIFDSIRIISPVRKKIISFNDGVLHESQDNCYSFWSQEKVCDNCISMRALNEKDTFFKLSWVNDKIFVVIAIPIQDNDDTVILELLKEVTNSMSVDIPNDVKNNSLLQVLNEIGQLQIKDSLTGLYNRRFIDERLPTDILNCSVDQKSYTIVFADIDRFKLVNDKYGHVIGDHVLKEFAKILKDSVMDREDWVARYGGEEFLIYTKNSSLSSAVDFTENIRIKVQDSELDLEGNKIKITSSFGVCLVNKKWDIKPEELINQADQNLYVAKSSGRNRTVASEL
jgi:diguanylate cyclase (GGDEF) domain